MESQLQQIGWSAHFSHSVKPTDVEGFPSLGARGCFLSHLEALKRGERTGDHVLIMEDDLNFIPDFSRHWQTAIDFLDRTDWAIFYPAHLFNHTDGLSLVDPNEGIRCTHFLAFHRETIPKITAGLQAILSRPAGHPLGGPMHVDGAYSTLRRQDRSLKTFIFSPSLGIQRSSRSDVADPRCLDRISVIRPALNTLRRIKQRMQRRW